MNQQSGIMNLKSSYAWGYDLSGTEQGAGGVGGLLFAKLHSATAQPSSTTAQPSVLAPSYDGNGNITAWIDLGSGNVQARYEYDAFGKVILREESKPNQPLPAFGFSTKYTDAETGLCYYGYRYYSPELGRWPNRDPLGDFSFREVQKRLHSTSPSLFYGSDASLRNLYAFVDNNPVGAIDILGLRRSKGECCSEAVSMGLAAGSGGGVICCDGRKVACNWIWKPDDNGGQNDVVEDIYRKCVTKHERDHFDDIDSCPKCDGITRPGWKAGKNPDDEEAHAGCKEVKCYERNIDDCRNAPDEAACRREIQGRIDQLRNDPVYGRDCN
jgi:RHS repeat-associated protein